jgi:hypothetical protein
MMGVQVLDIAGRFLAWRGFCDHGNLVSARRMEIMLTKQVRIMSRCSIVVQWQAMLQYPFPARISIICSRKQMSLLTEIRKKATLLYQTAEEDSFPMLAIGIRHAKS